MVYRGFGTTHGFRQPLGGPEPIPVDKGEDDYNLN